MWIVCIKLIVCELCVEKTSKFILRDNPHNTNPRRGDANSQSYEVK